MAHFQASVNKQGEFFQLLPAFNIKSVNQAPLVYGAKQINPLITGTHREWADWMQQFDGDWETKKNRARQYFNLFVNPTFKSVASALAAVEFFNEIWAESQTPEERQMRIEQDQAAIAVWNDEYRTQPELSHIRLALSSAAVGNSLPKQIAQIAITDDGYVNYHSYIAVYWPGAAPQRERLTAISTATVRASFHPQNGDATPYMVTDNRGRAAAMITEDLGTQVGPGERSEGDWRWCSGRWHFDEQAWGLKPRWLLTECGPVRDYTGGLILDPQGGHKLIWGNDGWPQMVDMMRQWLGDVVQTPAYQEGRIEGFHVFTSGGGETWKWFEVAGDALVAVGGLIREVWTAEPPPDPPPPPPPPPGDGQLRDFEGGWTDLSDRIQVPDLFTVEVLHPGTPLFYPGEGPATGTVEGKMAICGVTVPANECVGGGDPVLLDGEQGFKFQAVTMRSGSAITTVFSGTGRKRISVPVQCHYQAPDVYDRVPPLEAIDVYAVLLLNGVEVDRLQFPELLDREFMLLSGEADAPVTATLRFQTSYRNSRDLFTDQWRCEDVTPDPPPPPPPPPPDARAYGIDVSRWQGAINWATAKAAGVQFVFAKASEHTTWTDPLYASNVTGARGQDILISGYHFYRPEFDPIAQAEHFWSVIGERGDLRPALDVEVAGPLASWLSDGEDDHHMGQFLRPAALAGVSPFENVVATLAEDVIACLVRLRELSGVLPVLYTGIDFFQTHLQGVTPEHCELWIADWTLTRTEPVLPAAWTGDWRCWQFSSDADGPAHGAQSARIDVNRFNGTFQDLEEWSDMDTNVIPECVHTAINAVIPHKAIRIHPQFALAKRIKQDGRDVVSDELGVPYGGITYKWQTGQDPDGKRWKYISWGPDWDGNLQVFEVT